MTIIFHTIECNVVCVCFDEPFLLFPVLYIKKIKIDGDGDGSDSDDSLQPAKPMFLKDMRAIFDCVND